MRAKHTRSHARSSVQIYPARAGVADVRRDPASVRRLFLVGTDELALRQYVALDRRLELGASRDLAEGLVARVHAEVKVVLPGRRTRAGGSGLALVVLRCHGSVRSSRP